MSTSIEHSRRHGHFDLRHLVVEARFAAQDDARKAAAPDGVAHPGVVRPAVVPPIEGIR